MRRKNSRTLGPHTLTPVSSFLLLASTAPFPKLGLSSCPSCHPPSHLVHSLPSSAPLLPTDTSLRIFLLQDRVGMCKSFRGGAGGRTWHFVLTRNFLYFRVCNLTAICFPSTPLGDVLTTNLRALLLPSLHTSEAHQRLSCGDRIIHIAWHRSQPGPLG